MRSKTRHQITIKSTKETSDGAGGYDSSATNTTIGTYFASVQRVMVGQKSEEGRTFAEDVLLFRTRYNVFDITSVDGFTLTYNSKIYKINSIENEGEANKWLLITCSNDTT